MRAKAHQLIDGLTGTGSCEFMTAFADPYPAWVIAEVLGIPADRFDAFLGWATDIGLGFSAAIAAEQARVDTAVAGLYACCDELTEQRRANPADDLVSALIVTEVAGQRLTADELRSLFQHPGLRGPGHHPQPAGPGDDHLRQAPRAVAAACRAA